ncbi:MAG: glycerophosphodiester phosphodiesterase family protein [Pseudomonadota bacterium]
MRKLRIRRKRSAPCTLARVAVCLAVACSTAGSKPEKNGDSDEVSAQRPFAGVDLAAYLDCAREQGVTLLQAHRAGDRPGAAENSLAAINKSLADGAVFMEIDVARTVDGVLVLMHDDTLVRTTTGTGAVVTATFADLSTLSLIDVEGRDTGEGVPTLADALGALEGRGFAQIDRKRSTSFDQIATVIEDEQAADRSMVITYSIEEAIAVHRRLPGVMISTGIDGLDDVATLEAADVDLSRVTAWLGLGRGKPGLDRELAARGIETSYGDFRAESDGSMDYRLLSGNGAELLSVDDVYAAANALDAAAVARKLLSDCPAARE